MAQKLNPAIIGGGYAGMAAAVTFAAHGVPVTVFESAPQLGGRARGVAVQQTQLDNGQHILLGCYTQLLDLIEQVGGCAAEDFLRLPLQLTLHNRFELKAPRLPAPLHVLFALLFASGLNWAERCQAARFMLAMKAIKFQLNQDISVDSLLKFHGQSQALIRRLWEPICISALNTPLHLASAQVLLNVLRDSLNGSFAASEMLLPRKDLSTLFPARAAEYVRQRGGEVLTSCAVEAIQPVDEGVQLLTAQGWQTFSHLVCAASPSASARLFRPVPALFPSCDSLEKLIFQPIVTVYLRYPTTVRLPQAMLGFDACLSQWVFDQGQISGQAGLLAVVISAQGAHQSLSHAELAEKVKSELNQQLGISCQTFWHQVIAEKRATFACEVNVQRPLMRTALSSILLAGDAVAGDYPATLEGAVISGKRAANAILDDCPLA